MSRLTVSNRWQHKRGFSMSKKIQLTRGKFAIVDNEDYAIISKFQWYYLPTANKEYAARASNGKTQYLHRQLMKAKSGMTVDHQNGNGLDCRRSNLRCCLLRNNQKNKQKRCDNKTGFKGVRFTNRRKHPYYASIFSNGKGIFLGCFGTAIEAAKAYNQAAKKYHGKYAKLNQNIDY